MFRSRWMIVPALLVISALVWVAVAGPGTVRHQIGLTSEIRSVHGVEDGWLYQRPASTPIQLSLSGTAGFLANEIEFAVVTGDAIRPEDWMPLDASPRFFFAGAVQIPAGWNAVALRSRGARGARPLSPVRVGVGEIFLVAGQSNAAGSSQTFFLAESDRVRVAQLDEDGRVEGWRQACDPQVRNGGGSVWPLVGAHLSAQLGVPVGFINCAVGSTSIDQWQPGQPEFERLAAIIRNLGPDGFRAVLWHQGEADQGTPEPEYFQKLRQAITRSREIAGADVPWIVALASFQDGKTGAGVRGAQARLATENLALPGPDTDGLGSDFRETADGVHFNEAGTRAAAQLWSEAILRGLSGIDEAGGSGR